MVSAVCNDQHLAQPVTTRSSEVERLSGRSISAFSQKYHLVISPTVRGCSETDMRITRTDGRQLYCALVPSALDGKPLYGFLLARRSPIARMNCVSVGGLPYLHPFRMMVGVALTSSLVPASSPAMTFGSGIVSAMHRAKRTVSVTPDLLANHDHGFLPSESCAWKIKSRV